MSTVVQELGRIVDRLKEQAGVFDSDPVAPTIKCVDDAVNTLNDAASGSWIGYQASVYTSHLQPRRPGEHFDTEWGAQDAFSNRTTGSWSEFTYEAIYTEVLKRAGKPNLSIIEQAVKNAREVFEECKDELLAELDVLLSQGDDAVVREIRKIVEEATPCYSRQDFIKLRRPKGSIISRDTLAMYQGIKAPHHIAVEAWLVEQRSHGTCCNELAKVAKRALTYVKKKSRDNGGMMVQKSKTVFIGHGRSSAWRDLKDLLVDRLGLSVEEFGRVATAGKSVKERLVEMLDASGFAFLVMTAEDETKDGKHNARMNVVHEVGLFQGRLGFEKAIVLLEEGCEEFSNIIGVQQIRFPAGRIAAVSEEIRRVLEREGVLP